ncbi:MAG TPA: hypothetical protein VFD29_01150 [Gillisia sp.]|nr:hypothetical protein [Gillisia sp.]
MKKLLLVVVFTIFGFVGSYAQSEFRIGVNAGVPLGDADDISTFNFGADFAYLFGVTDVFSVGPLVGYSHFLGKGDKVDYHFIPLAASGRFGLSDTFFIGADLGYAIGADEGNDGGFFYRPKLGYDFGIIGLIASYSGIEVDGGSFNSVNLGIEFGF